MSRYSKKKKVFFAFLLFPFIYFIATAISISNYAGKDETQQADVAIVLGTAIWGDQPSPVFREGSIRVSAYIKAGM